MEVEDFNQRITDLVNGEILEFTVEKEDFFTFRTSWLAHPDKKKIIGDARLGGRVIYTKVKSEFQ